MMKKSAGTLFFLALLAASLAFPAVGQQRPRMVILNVDYGARTPEELSSLSDNLPGAFLSSEQYDLVGIDVVRNATEEWARPSLLSEKERAIKLGEKYGVELVVVGDLVARTGKGWLLSFIVMNSPLPFRSREELLQGGGTARFYSYLSEDDPRVAEALEQLKAFFKFPALHARKTLPPWQAAAALDPKFKQPPALPLAKTKIRRIGDKNKPRIAIVNIVHDKEQLSAPRKPGEKRAQGAFLSSRNFELAEMRVLRLVAEEWGVPSLLSERERADKLAKKHGVDLIVSGHLLGFTKRGWKMSFVIMNSPEPYRTRRQILEHKAEFYTYLNEDDSRLAFTLGGLRSLFYIPADPNDPLAQEKPKDAIPGRGIKKLIGGKVVQATGNYLVQYRKDGTWAAATEIDGTFEERGNWWMKEDRFCVTVRKVKRPFCRFVIKVDGGYRLVMQGGAEQEILIK